MQLDELPLGKSASITKVGGQGALRQHFLDMGLLPGAEVQLVKYAPSGDPMEIRVQSYELSLRKADAAQISITGVHTDLDGDLSRQPHRYIDHPRLGEDSPYAPRGAQTPLAENELLTFALAGNQNRGKTTWATSPVSPSTARTG